MDEPDPRVVSAAAAGDRLAFEELVRHCQADVWRFLRHLVGDGELAADLTQDTLLRMHLKLGSFRTDGPFRAWILRIARNVAMDALRTRERQARRDRSLRSLRRHTQSAVQHPDSGLDLDEAIHALPIAQREVFALVEVAGYRYREVAEILAISEGTVKSRMFHARRQLIAWLADDEYEGDRRRG